MKIIILLLLHIINIAHTQACVRSDVGDPMEAVTKSIRLGSELPYSNTVGMITDGKRMASCVVIGPQHILTSAHTEFLHEGPNNQIIFTNYGTFGIKGASLADTVHSPESAHTSRIVRIDVHPGFRFLDASPIVFDSSNLDEYTLNMRNVNSALRSHHFEGPDLAVLTLDKPIRGVEFPEIYGGNYDEIQKQYGLSFGYGPPKVNTDNGTVPVEVGKDGVRLYKRHVMSHQVFFNAPNALLHGMYMTRWGYGDESFVAHYRHAQNRRSACPW